MVGRLGEAKTLVGDMVLANARLLDGMGGIMERATVRVATGRVAEIRTAAEVEEHPEVEIVDLTGKTLMPAYGWRWVSTLTRWGRTRESWCEWSRAAWRRWKQ